jgi:hypothetical protein
MEETTQATQDFIYMGAWSGRQQAFAVLAKETRCYEKLGLSWNDFCQQHSGMSRVHAVRIIRQYEEFGEAYFRLSSLARISFPESASLIRAFVRACPFQRRAGSKAGSRLACDWRSSTFFPTPAQAAKMSRQNVQAAMPVTDCSIRHRRRSRLIPDLELRLHALVQDVKEHLRPNTPVGHRLHRHPGMGPHRPPPGGDGSPQPLAVPSQE